MKQESIPRGRMDEQRARRVLNVATVLLLLSFLLFIVLLCNFATFDVRANTNQLPLSIRATAQADYSADSLGSPVPPIGLNILNEIILDVPSTGEPDARETALALSLMSPVPTMTANPAFQAFPTSVTSVAPTQALSTPVPLPSPILTSESSPPPTTSSSSSSSSSSSDSGSKSHPVHPPHPPQAQDDKNK